MKKEPITLDRIKKDVVKSILHVEFLGAVLIIPLFWVIFSFIALLLENGFTSLPLVKIVTLVFLIPELCYVIAICDALIRVQRAKFVIRTAVLTDKIKLHYTSHRTRIPYRLKFRDRHFILHYRNYYDWSLPNSMTQQDLFNTSHIGDSFTVVEIHKRIRIVYNNSIFDASELTLESTKN